MLAMEKAQRRVARVHCQTFFADEPFYFGCPDCPPSYTSYTGHSVRTRTDGVFHEDYLDRMRLVESAYDGCIAFGGGYWHISVHTNGSTDFEGGFCVPAGCSPRDVQAIGVYTSAFLYGYDCDVVEDFFETAAARLALRRNCWRNMRAHVQRLSSWDKLRLDWAIVGFGSGGGTGGTTSLAYNLGMHPSMDLITDGSKHLEESLFLYNCELHVPTESQVINFNSHSKTLSMMAGSSKSLTRGLLRGVKRGSYIRSDPPLSRLARIQRLRIVVVIMDPIEVVERSYLKFVSQCSYAFDVPNFDDCIRLGHCSCVRDSLNSDTVTWHRPKDGEANYTRTRLETAIEIFGAARVFVATQSDLNEGHEFWDKLAKFLGAPPFPGDTRFSRSNQHFDRRQWSAVLGVVLSRSHLLQGYCSGIALLRSMHQEDRVALDQVLQSLPRSQASELAVTVPAWPLSEAQCRARASERISYYNGGSMPVANWWQMRVVGLGSEKSYPVTGASEYSPG